MFSHCSQTLAYYFINSIEIPREQLAALIEAYIGGFSKIAKYAESVAQSVRTLWGVFSKLKNIDNLSNELVAVRDKERRPVIPVVIDFCVERLEEYLDSALTGMVFGILDKIVRCWPRVNSIGEKLPNIYPNFPDLL